MRGRGLELAKGGLVLLVGTSLTGWGQGADPKALFLSATASFHAGDYTVAERQFQACRAAIGDNLAVDYNLAMTYLRLGSLGRARVYLERCLALSPGDRATREQLRLLLVRLNEVETPPPSWVHAAWHGIRRSVTLQTAVTLAAAMNAVITAVLGVWLLTGRRWLGRASVAGLFVLPIVWAVAGSHLADTLRGTRAIVIAESAVVRGGPSDRFGEIERLREGQAVTMVARACLRIGPGLSLVVVSGEDSLWCEVRTPSGARGYLRRGLIEPI